MVAHDRIRLTGLLRKSPASSGALLLPAHAVAKFRHPRGPLPIPSNRMIFRQITHDDLGCASYLIGDEDAGVAAVVDPRLHIDEYLRLARYTGVRIEHVLETHTHADHVSGHTLLAEATGATIHVHRAAGAEYPHE